MPYDDKMIISSSILEDTADAIRERGGTNSTIKPINFATNISALPNAFTIPFSNATINGTVTATRTGATFSATADANGDGVIYVYGSGDYTIVDTSSTITRYITFKNSEGVIFRVIPDNFQAVEYLQNVGSGYIDTGVTSSSTLGIDIEFALDTVNTNGAIFGGRITQLTTTYTMFFLNTPRFRFDADGQRVIAEANNMLFNTTSKYRFRHDAVNHSCNITNLTSGDSVSVGNLNVSTFTTIPIALFAVNTNGSVGTYGQIKIYSCSFFDNGSEIHRFLPCYRKSDSMPGMYDSIIGEFFPAQGVPADLVCGPDIN